MTKKDFFLGLLKGLIIAYLMTFVLLAVLAFAMYKFRWGEQPVNIGIVLIYVLSSAICGAIMLTAVIAFLLMGFLGELWHIGWVVFPVGGILCGIISMFFSTKEK